MTCGVTLSAATISDSELGRIRTNREHAGALRASTDATRKALEAVYGNVVTADQTEWNQNPELLDWLASL